MDVVLSDRSMSKFVFYISTIEDYPGGVKRNGKYDASGLTARAGKDGTVLIEWRSVMDITDTGDFRLEIPISFIKETFIKLTLEK